MNKHGTKIGWTHFPGYKGETWNPIIGCSHISPGCDHCYAERVAGRLSNIAATAQYINVVERDDPAPLVHKGLPRWNGKTYLVEHMMDKPYHWKKPRAIFVCSMGDLFHDKVSYPLIDNVVRVMRNNRHHLFLILTKRPEKMLEYTRWYMGFTCLPNGKPLNPWSDNVWLGVTVENADYEDRLETLLNTPAPHHFVSIEPMLGQVDSRPYLYSLVPPYKNLDWVLCGGESGHDPRYMDPDWARRLKDDCKEAGTPFFMKQMSGKTPKERHAIPDDLMVQEFPEGMKL